MTIIMAFLICLFVLWTNSCVQTPLVKISPGFLASACVGSPKPVACLVSVLFQVLEVFRI